MLKKILGVSTLLVAGAYVATFMLEDEGRLSVKASGLDREVEQQLETRYGDSWDDILEESYGKNWSEEVEAMYDTSINDCVMMEVDRLNQDNEDFWEQCLENMYGDNWEAQLQEEYGADYRNYIETEAINALKLSGDLELDQDQDRGDSFNEMPRYNQKSRCHD